MSALVDLARRARETLLERCWVPPESPLVAACSGGADSVALVALLAELGREIPLAAVAFVDHGLRDVQAERAAAQAAAERAGARFSALRVVLGSGNRQAEAREARYRALEDLARPLGALCATGHTRTDQAETVLERLVRGVGVVGLGGIQPRHGPIVRPLLEIGRAELRALDLPFAEDPTNAADHYQRNRLRHQVWPLLARENPALEEALAACAEAAQDERAVVDALCAALDLAGVDYRGTDPRLAQTLIRWRQRRELPGLPPPSRPAVEALARQLARGAVRKAVSLGRGLRGVADRGELRLEPDTDPRFELVAWGTGTYRLPGVHLTVEVSDCALAPAAGGPAPGAADAWFAPEAIAWPLTCRTVRPGDRIALGAPPELRDALGLLAGGSWGTRSGLRQLVVVDARGEVLWGPGVGRSARAAWLPGRDPSLHLRLQSEPFA